MSKIEFRKVKCHYKDCGATWTIFFFPLPKRQQHAMCPYCRRWNRKNIESIYKAEDTKCH